MSDLLNIGGSGLRAYQTALTTVSENIANAGTAGYVRRTTRLNEIAAGSTGITQRVGVEGNGVLASGVLRAADRFRSADVRIAGADLSRTETGVAWLGRIEGALSGNQLSSRVTAFFTSATAVAADPTATAPRATMLEAAKGAADAFAATGRALDRLDTELAATTDQAGAQIGSIGKALAEVNAGLGRVQPGTSASAQLLDQRDQLLEQMSALTDVAASFDDAGRATVRVGGSAGPVLVAGTEAGAVFTARGDDGQVSFSVVRSGTVSGFAPQDGALAGFVDAASRIAGARDGLNEIAKDFASGVNGVQAQGRDLNGQPGAALFATGSSPSDLSVTLTDPRGIAAASVGAGPRNAGNLAALANLRTSGGYEAGITGIVTTNAAALASQKQVAEAQGAIRDGAVAARDNAAGVSLDAEAVDLMRFQQAYQASSRVIQVARETFQSIIAIN